MIVTEITRLKAALPGVKKIVVDSDTWVRLCGELSRIHRFHDPLQPQPATRVYLYGPIFVHDIEVWRDKKGDKNDGL